MLTPYIHNLIENLPTKERNLDIVLEGGAFNGSFEYGILYFFSVCHYVWSLIWYPIFFAAT